MILPATSSLSLGCLYEHSFVLRVVTTAHWASNLNFDTLSIQFGISRCFLLSNTSIRLLTTSVWEVPFALPPWKASMRNQSILQRAKSPFFRGGECVLTFIWTLATCIFARLHDYAISAAGSAMIRIANHYHAVRADHSVFDRLSWPTLCRDSTLITFANHFIDPGCTKSIFSSIARRHQLLPLLYGMRSSPIAFLAVFICSHSPDLRSAAII